MTYSSFKLSEVKLALKRKGLNYKLQHYDSEDYFEGCLTFLNEPKGTKVCGKVVRSFTEGEVCHWPLLSHANVVPLFDVLYIRDDLSIFFTADFQIKLKDIIHDEDFVYDSECFDRKRAYARGIFSGLSYLHGKSLCLMNLSDDNIFICKIYDKAVITNFSSLACSRKTRKSKLNVPELYKAPESEKGEFDAIAAEIWASGTLMLDMFLAHMVPWAIIDYKPRRILKIVDKLSMELLHAANAGSIISTIDLAKFKAFLKCFFRENPFLRITARYASIASFLSPRLKDSTLHFDAFKKTVHPNTKCISQHTNEKSIVTNCLSPQSAFLPRQTVSKQRESTYENFSRQRIPVRHFDSEQSTDLFMGSEVPKWLTPKYMDATSNFSKGDKSFCDVREASASTSATPLEHRYNVGSAKGIKTEIGIEAETPGNISENYKLDQLDIKPFSENDSPFTVSETFLGLQKTSKSCQMIKDVTTDLNESSYACYQSKSLSFLKPIVDEASNAISFQFCSSRNCSYSSIKSLSMKQPSKHTLQKSDLCLDRLFGENELSEEVIDETEVTHEVSDFIKIGNVYSRKDFLKCFPNGQEKISSNDTLEEQETRMLPNEKNTNLRSNSDIYDITEQITLLRKCQVSLQNHPRLFSREEFVEKQQNLINEYQLLLRQEKIRLIESLKNKYALNMGEILELIRNRDSRSKYLGFHTKKSLTHSKYNSSREFPVGNLVGNRGNAKRVDRKMIHCTNNKSKNSCVVPHLRPTRRYSYCRAIEMAENHMARKGEYEAEREKRKKELEGSIFVRENKSKDKLIETGTKGDKITTGVNGDQKLEATNTKNRQAVNQKEQEVLNTNKDASKTSSKGRKKRGKKDKNGPKLPRDHKKIEDSRRSFFYTLCPGGKVDEPTPIVDYLCETCKLNYEAI